ncbi:MAG: type II toxin-antitoxin system PemK/MazF family toxin [Chloroflexi bacterium]|nr:type II toxin-antitoxin system PemK/MazF family toxin [Chloroflexota bacterium]
MGKFVKGDVVVIPFPFSDLSASKKRPAFVVTQLTGDDVILCMITTPAKADNYSIPVMKADFIAGGIDHDSHVRPNRLFTADSKLVTRSAGKLSRKKIEQVISKIIEIVQS